MLINKVSWYLVFPLLATLLVGGVSSAWGEATDSAEGLSPEELKLEPPEEGSWPYLGPIQATEVTGDVVLRGVGKYSYIDGDGRYVVDLLEKEQAYLGVRITTEDGRPVVGAMPDLSIAGSSRLELSELMTAEDGVVNFGVIGGIMGLDHVTARVGEQFIEFQINVISLRAAGFPVLPEIEGGIGWDQLMQAKVEYTSEGLQASFPESIKQQAGQTVKVSGFMMPLQPDIKQTHFILTSNPPSCFFHVPGGAAGSVEVVSAEPIEVSWNPVVIEGTFMPLEMSGNGVVYKMVDARQVVQ